MRSNHGAAGLLAVAIFGTASLSRAQVGDAPPSNPAVGVPGCSSDIVPAATRRNITLSRDGREVPAIIYEPATERRAGSALVMLHGRTIREDVTALDAYAVQLASRGIYVVFPFYLQARGVGDAPSEGRAAHRIWRGVALDAASAIALEAELEPRHVALWGHGLGGGVALAATLEPDSPVGGAVGVNIGGSPQDDAEGGGRPFLLVHSARSSLLPPREVRTMAERIEERGGDVERVEVASDYGRFGRDDWCRTIDATRGLLERIARVEPPA